MVLAVALALSAAGGDRVGLTDAAWRTDQPVTGAFEALIIPAPRLTEPCHYDRGVLGLGAEVVIHWVAPTDYHLTDAKIYASTSGLGSALAPLTGFDLARNTKYNAHSGHYTTTVPTNLLGGLLGLGAELEVSIRMTRYGWISKSASIATNAGLIAGLGGTCRNLP